MMALVLATSVLISGNSSGLAAICSRGEKEGLYECYRRVSGAMISGLPKEGCVPRVGPPDMIKNEVIPRIANFLASHAQLGRLEDKEAVSTAFTAAYPCPHKP